MPLPEPTGYTSADASIQGPKGNFKYMSKLTPDIPDYFERLPDGTIVLKYGVISFTGLIRAETVLEFFTPLAALSGSWQDLPPLPYVTQKLVSQKSIDGPYTLNLVDVKFMFKENEINLIETHAFDLEVKLSPATVLRNGVPILRINQARGI